MTDSESPTMELSGSKRPWAVVTGASSGLGVAFAEDLATRGYNVVLTARRDGDMRRLAAELSSRHAIEAAVEPLDLAAPGAARALMERLEARGIEADVLVNNAGFGLHGRFVDHPGDRLGEMLRLDVLALTELTLEMGRRMVARDGGHILLVASMAAFQPTPLYAAYGAAKAYVLSLGEALHVEFAPKVGVTVLSPGLMDTGFLSVAGQQPTSAMTRNMVKPADAARLGLDALFAGRPSAITGALNRVAVFSNRLTSRNLQARMILRIQQG